MSPATIFPYPCMPPSYLSHCIACPCFTSITAATHTPNHMRHILTHVDPPPSADASLRVHYLGPEKELLILPLFRELALLMPSTALHVDMIGPVAFDLPSKPLVYDGPRGGCVTITAHRGAYHTLAREGSLPLHAGSRKA